MKKVLAIDMGATSIRAILAYLESGKLVSREVMRLSHHIVDCNGRKKWQWQEMMHAITDCIGKYHQDLDAVAVDTWGVDFGAVNKNHEPYLEPYSYRDENFIQVHKEATQIMNDFELFSQTGNQVMSLNTLFQLLALRKLNPEEYRDAEQILMLPDYVAYLLGAEAVGEKTIWSTSSFLDLKNIVYKKEVLSKFSFAEKLFPKLVDAGCKIGNTKNSVFPELRNYDIDIFAVCGHDTASAVLLNKSFSDEDCLFLSCGTWSLMGYVSDAVHNSATAYKKNLTNELTYADKSMTFKNLNGLFLFELFKKQEEARLGHPISFEQINEYMERNQDTEQRIIDTQDVIFSSVDIDAKKEIDLYLAKSNFRLPENNMEYFKIIYESLIWQYIQAKSDLEELRGKKFRSVNIMGGGAKSKPLCHLIAQRLGVELYRGPVEASALGNILLLLKGVGEISSLEEGISLILESQEQL